MNLTPEQIDAMAAGTELEAIVAEHVMGWKRVNDPETTWLTPKGRLIQWYDVPQFSTDIASVFEVVEKMHADGDLLSLTWQSGIFDGDNRDKIGWFAHFRLGSGRTFSASDSAPLAICRAALKAVLSRKVAP